MAYDALGNRIQKQVDSDGNGSVDYTQRYSYDGFKTGPQKSFVGNENFDVLLDLDGSSSLTTRYVHGSAIDQLFARIGADTNAYWTLLDRMGSVRDVLDAGGALKSHLDYGAFGNTLSESDANFTGRYGWTGREIEREAELQYNRRRFYDPRTARWITQDPLGFDAGDSNLYRYVRNSVTVATDPSGLEDIYVRDGRVFWVIERPRSGLQTWDPDVREVEIGALLKDGGDVVVVNGQFGPAHVSLKDLKGYARNFWTSNPDISKASENVQNYSIKSAIYHISHGRKIVNPSQGSVSAFFTGVRDGYYMGRNGATFGLIPSWSKKAHELKEQYGATTFWISNIVGGIGAWAGAAAGVLWSAPAIGSAASSASNAANLAILRTQLAAGPALGKVATTVLSKQFAQAAGATGAGMWGLNFLGKDGTFAEKVEAGNQGLMATLGVYVASVMPFVPNPFNPVPNPTIPPAGRIPTPHGRLPNRELPGPVRPGPVIRPELVRPNRPGGAGRDALPARPGHGVRPTDPPRREGNRNEKIAGHRPDPRPGECVPAGDAPLTGTGSLLSQAERNLVNLARGAESRLGSVPSGRTVASTTSGQRTLSGWTPTSGYANSAEATNEVIALSQRMGHRLTPAGALDQGVAGRFNASHAERQIAAMNPNQPIAVSREMCGDCQQWFSDLARYRQQSQVVSDPRWVRVFRPDGTVVEIPR